MRMNWKVARTGDYLKIENMPLLPGREKKQELILCSGIAARYSGTRLNEKIGHASWGQQEPREPSRCVNEDMSASLLSWLFGRVITGKTRVIDCKQREPFSHCVNFNLWL